MPGMCCAPLQWCGRPYGGTFAFEAQIHKNIGIMLPNKALYILHQLYNHLPSSNNEANNETVTMNE